MHTSHPGNVGAAARAMKVMGFAALVLVQPRFADVLSQEETVAFASGAADILARARVVDTLAQALQGISFAAATAMTPRDPDYGSLNLAQALQLLAYDWRQALGGYAVTARTAEPAPATVDELDGALAHWRQALLAIGFLDPAVPRKLMPRLQQLLNRAQLSRDELHILRGVARAVLAAAPAPAAEPAPPAADPT
ncbi:MAG: rRNA methyltransferase [Burkholderiales bacterium PBB5]|nr:MAG: rRNA methyltransferase [Burkholderiales bacterium PBB5]